MKKGSHLSLVPNSHGAKSWGLNRTIFYQAAKNGYIQRRGKKFQQHGENESLKNSFQYRKRKNLGILYSVGKEKIFVRQTNCSINARVYNEKKLDGPCNPRK